MIRRFTSLLLVSLLTVVGLTAANPASADAGFSPTVTAPTDAYMGISFPMSDEKVLRFWVEEVGGLYSLKSGILRSSGTFTDITNVGSAPTGYYIDYPTKGSVAMTPDGVVAITWIQRKLAEGNILGSSDLNVSYSDDGTDWSAPVVVASRSFDAATFGCDSMFISLCGYSSPQLSIDAFGTMGIVAIDENFIESQNRVVATSSRDGANWGNLAQLWSTGSNFKEPTVLALPRGGFMTTWGVHDGDDWVFKYSTMTTSILNYWKPAKTIGTHNYPVHNIVTQTSETQISFFMTSNQGNSFALRQRTYDLVTKVWSDSSTLFTRENWMPRGELEFDRGINWHSAVGFGLLENGAANGAAYLIELNRSVPGTVQVVDTTTLEQGLYLTALSANPDGSVSLATHGMDILPKVKRFKAGVELASTSVPIADPNNQFLDFEGAATPNGNIFFFSASDYTTRDAIVYVQASAPTHSGTPSVRGTAKKGAKLTAGTLIFSSVSGISANTFQWYACSSAVPANTTSVPAGCVSIAKATASTFKVTSKQKGKFITVAVKNTNPVGTTTIFAPVATRSK